MAIISPDRTKQVRGKTLRTIDKGKTAGYIVVENGDKTIAHLIQIGPQNIVTTVFPTIERFETEEDARAAYPGVLSSR